MSHPEPPARRDPKTLARHLAIPVTSLFDAWNRRDRVTVITTVIAGALTAWGTFGHQDPALYAALAVLAGLTLWLTHARVTVLRATDPTAPAKLIYASAVVIAFPFAYAQVMFAALLVSLAIVALGLFVVYLIFTMFVGGGSTGTSSRGTTITRGANSHLNADGTPKKAYLNIDEAQNAALDYFNDRGEKMSAYRCADGNHFHIGHAK